MYHECRSRYCINVGRHTRTDRQIDIEYVILNTVCKSTCMVCMSVDILYVSRDTVCQQAVVTICRSRYCISTDCVVPLEQFSNPSVSGNQGD